MQNLHPLADGQVLVLFVPLHWVPLLTEVLTAPLQVELQKECPVLLTEGREGGREEGEGGGGGRGEEGGGRREREGGGGRGRGEEEEGGREGGSIMLATEMPF